MRQQYHDRGVWSRHITKSRYFGTYTRAPYWYGIWNGGSKAAYWNGAKNLISTTVYSIACNLTRLPIWRSSIFKSCHIYRTTTSYSDLSSISVKYGASILDMEVQPNGPLFRHIEPDSKLGSLHYRLNKAFDPFPGRSRASACVSARY